MLIQCLTRETFGQQELNAECLLFRAVSLYTNSRARGVGGGKNISNLSNILPLKSQKIRLRHPSKSFSVALTPLFEPIFPIQNRHIGFVTCISLFHLTNLSSLSKLSNLLHVSKLPQSPYIFASESCILRSHRPHLQRPNFPIQHQSAHFLPYLPYLPYLRYFTNVKYLTYLVSLIQLTSIILLIILSIVFTYLRYFKALPICLYVSLYRKYFTCCTYLAFLAPKYPLSHSSNSSHLFHLSQVSYLSHLSHLSHLSIISFIYLSQQSDFNLPLMPLNYHIYAPFMNLSCLASTGKSAFLLI